MASNNEWITYKIEDLGEVVGGGTPSTKKSEYLNGKIPWITPKDLSNFTGTYLGRGERNISKQGLQNSSAKLLPKDTVLLSSRAPIGYLAIAANKLTTNQGFKSIICNEDIVLPFYLFYSLKNDIERIKALGTGSTFSELSGKAVKQIELRIPSIKTQKKVVDILKNIDYKIEINRNTIANLEELSQTLFKRWFVDFEFPDENGNPYKSSGGEMYSTRLGEIPITFYPGTLKDLLNIKSGYAFKSSWWVDSGVPVIKIKDIQDNGIDLKNLSYVAPVHASKANDFIVRGGEILMALTGATVSKNYIVPLLSEPALVNQRVGLVTKSNSFKYFLLNLHLIRNEIIERAHGSAQPNVSPKNILAINFPIPNTNTIEDFLTKTRDMYEMISIKSYENTQLARLRDYLLPKLMSGEIELSEGLEADEHAELLQ